MTIVHFFGIDNYNRPVFRTEDGRDYYGAPEILFPRDASEEEVLAKVQAEDLTYFGRSFSCEPMGTPCNDIVIKGTGALREAKSCTV